LPGDDPVAFLFKRTKNDYKVLFGDGNCCEFAVFDEEEMKSAGMDSLLPTLSNAS